MGPGLLILLLRPDVRGHLYGTQRGQSFWSLQLDVPTGRRWFHPVFFADAGQAGTPTGEARLGRQPVLVGAGIGFRLAGAFSAWTMPNR